MWKTTFDGCFGAFDAADIPVSASSAAPTLLPKPRGKCNGNAEQIMIQANEANAGVIVIGQTQTLPSGFRLAPGGTQILPDNSYTSWRLYATAAGCVVTVSYVAGPK